MNKGIANWKSCATNGLNMYTNEKSVLHLKSTQPNGMNLDKTIDTMKYGNIDTLYSS